MKGKEMRRPQKLDTKMYRYITSMMAIRQYNYV
jgi:hypothetical protein